MPPAIKIAFGCLRNTDSIINPIIGPAASTAKAGPHIVMFGFPLFVASSTAPKICGEIMVIPKPRAD